MIERLKTTLAPPPWLRPGTGRAIDVGWLLDIDKARFIWGEPRRVRRRDPPPTHAESVNYCPSVLDHEARMFEAPCPIDLRLRFRRDENRTWPIRCARDKSMARRLIANASACDTAICNRRAISHLHPTEGDRCGRCRPAKSGEAQKATVKQRRPTGSTSSPSIPPRSAQRPIRLG